MTQPNQTTTKNAFSLIVGDIHLQPESEHPINQSFIQFLENEAVHAEALYILGDLFEMWVGDDIGLEQYSDIIALFKKLTDDGLNIYLQYGNRDFLMQKQFCLATGIEILDDIALVTLYDSPYLLLHGDQLCTDDKGYQRMRRIVRNRAVQWLFLHLCRKRRLAIGNKMRSQSKQHSQAKAADIMDVNPQAVLSLFSQFPNVKNIIHGHTHRPQHHQINQENQTFHRWVLGDWRPASQIIKVDKKGLELIKYPS